MEASWIWWALAAVLLISELLITGFFLLWLGLAAGLVGLVVFLFPLSWPLSFTLFGVLSALLVFLCRPMLIARKNSDDSDTPHLNNRMQSYVGKVYILAEPIISHKGRLNIDDTLWDIEGPNLAKGTYIKITSVRDKTLLVEEASK